MGEFAFKVVTLSGLPGTGTTTAARLVEAATGYTYVNTGAIFRQMARERGVALNEFGKRAAADPSIDRELDARQIALARKGGIVLEGRLSGYMVYSASVPALKVLLETPLSVRVERVARRDQLSFPEAERLTLEREKDERSRYLGIYGFDLNRVDIYDVVLDSGKLSPDQIGQAILDRMR
jgi:cytidylate kinase